MKVEQLILTHEDESEKRIQVLIEIKPLNEILIEFKKSGFFDLRKLRDAITLEEQK
jgi:hypothetical protein